MFRDADRGFTLLELLLVVALISIITALAMPGLTRARRVANEASAIASLRVLDTAERVYADTCGKSGFASAFAVLATPPPGSTTAFISPDFSGATPLKGGYRFTLGPGADSAAGPADCNGTATISTYYATAVPISFNISGSRSFASNTAHVIWQVMAVIAPTEPFSAPAAPIQ